ncbi:DMT family transporter [Flavobacterium sp. CYK-4]|uniref:DMT family transporter n=1 Tax=Flavobacterium lotistagni TaxID=2709660 RepID=UPI00140D50CE|nr:DMT family transporter [Flavobacterium lotistagni]NHM05921.1 DMT family transporter [Flavobacterium lotistagni]
MARQLKWILLAVLALIWGSSFILIKKGLVGLNPMQLGSLRIIFAALFLLLIGFRTLPNIPLHKWKFIALTALFGTFMPAYLFALAETNIESSITSILNSLTPLNALILGLLIFKLEYKRAQVLGVIIGFVGTAVLILNGAANHPSQNYFYAGFAILGAVCYGINVNLIKKYLSDLSPLSISTGNFLVMSVPAAIILYCSGFFSIIDRAPVQHSAYFILILGVVGTGVANLLFYRLIHLSSPVFATTVTYLIPIVAFFWGVLDGEFLTLVQCIGAVIILIGVYLSSKK